MYKSSEGKLCFTVQDFKFKTSDGHAPNFLREHEIGVGYEVKMLNGSLRSPSQQHTVNLKTTGQVTVDTLLLMKMKIGSDGSYKVETNPTCYEVDEK